MGRIDEILKKDWTRTAVFVIGILFFVFAAIVIAYFVVVLCNDVAALSTYSPYPLPLTEARWMMQDNVSEAIKNALTVVCTYDAGELMAEFLATEEMNVTSGSEPSGSTTSSTSKGRKIARLKRKLTTVIKYNMELRNYTAIGETKTNASQIGFRSKISSEMAKCDNQRVSRKKRQVQPPGGTTPPENPTGISTGQTTIKTTEMPGKNPGNQQSKDNASQESEVQYELAYRNRSKACLEHIPVYMDKMDEGIQKYSELSFAYWEQTMCLVYIAVDIFMIVLNSLFLASCYLLVVAARRLEPACCLPFIVLAGAAVFADVLYWIFRDSIVLPEDYVSVARIIVVVIVSVIFIGLVIYCICIVARFISSTYEKTLPADSPQAGPKQVTDGNREREVKDD